jgi:hypothetical protein
LRGALCTKSSNNNGAGFIAFLKVGVRIVFLEKSGTDGTLRPFTRGAGRICSPSLSKESEHFFSATMVDQKRR